MFTQCGKGTFFDDDMFEIVYYRWLTNTNFSKRTKKSLNVKLKNTVVTVVVDVIVSLSLTVNEPLNKSSKAWLLLCLRD